MLKRKKGTLRFILPPVLAAAVLSGAFILWDNLSVQTTVYHIYDETLPRGFEDYKIAQISDLHNAKFGGDNTALVEILEKQRPDAIVFTGDLVDSRHTDLNKAVTFAERAAKIAPCYYVTGNHEARLAPRLYEELEQKLSNSGVTILRGRAETLVSKGDTLKLIGVDDPDFAEDSMFGLSEGIVSTEIQNAGAGGEYTILLSHRPELFETYAEQNINLAFCGHAHGGQVRLPLIGGLIAPGQGLFPKYDSGVFEQGDTTMVVSRGVGNSILPVRLYNRPEVVIAVLHAQPKQGG